MIAAINGTTLSDVLKQATARLNAATPKAGAGFELDVIAPASSVARRPTAG